MRINPPPQHLSAFLRVAESGSFTEAARQEGLSQPALSRIIQLLEEEIGQRLFDRTTRKVELTATGALLRPVATHLLAEYEAAFTEISQFAAGERGRVTVAALPSVAAVLLPRAIARLARLHPHVEVVILDNLAGPVVEAVQQGRADLGLAVQPPTRVALTYTPLMTDAFGLVCRMDDPLAQDPAPLWSSFIPHRFVAMNPSSSVRMMTDAAFLQAGLAITPHFECAFLGTAGHLVAAGLGITALPWLTLPLLGAPGLSWRPLAPRFTRQIGMVSRLGRSAPPALAHLQRLLREEARLIEQEEAPRRAAPAGP